MSMSDREGALAQQVFPDSVATEAPDGFDPGGQPVACIVETFGPIRVRSAHEDGGVRDIGYWLKDDISAVILSRRGGFPDLVVMRKDDWVAITNGQPMEPR